MFFILFSLVLSINNRPIIGIVTLPDAEKGQYMAASYVKWLEMSGSRVLPIFLTDTPSKLDPILEQINGVLFTGGGTSWSGMYSKTINHILEFARNSFDVGDPFPIWGTCLGFESLLEAESTCNCKDILSHVDADDLTLPVDFTSNADDSTMFPNHSSIAQIARNVFSTSLSTQNEHSWSVLPSTFSSDKDLSSKFNILATSKDRSGTEFIAIVESKDGQPPMFAVQFHPEKVTFEWGQSHSVPHDENSILANNYLSTFFVDQCRQSSRTMTDKVYDQYAIYNFSPRFSGKSGGYFEQRYEWSNHDLHRFFRYRIHSSRHLERRILSVMELMKYH